MKKIIYILIASTLLLNVSCEKLPDFNLLKKKSLQEKFSKRMPEIQEMSELGCVEYTVSTVITPTKDNKKDNKWYGKRKISYNCVAYIKAGVNLKKLDASKITIDENNKSIVLTLPYPNIQSCAIDEEKITVAYEKRTGIIGKYTLDDRLEIRKKGEEKIRASIKDMGILEDAEKNADMFFRNLLKGMGFEIITIKFEKDEKSN